MYIDVPATPNAVVICVIVFNAAFGYSWGPIPWLYPPEVCSTSLRIAFRLMVMTVDHASYCPSQRSLVIDCN
jgi:hypothetical protein